MSTGASVLTTPIKLSRYTLPVVLFSEGIDQTLDHTLAVTSDEQK